MKVRIISMRHFWLEPENDSDRIILEDWRHNSNDWICKFEEGAEGQGLFIEKESESD